MFERVVTQEIRRELFQVVCVPSIVVLGRERKDTE